jgi:hypothetical protein
MRRMKWTGAAVLGVAALQLLTLTPFTHAQNGMLYICPT